MAEKIIHIQASSTTGLSKEQKKFNQQVQRIAELRALIEKHKDAAIWLQELSEKHLTPTNERYKAAFEGYLRKIYALCKTEKLTKTQREKIDAFLTDQITMLEEQYGIDLHEIHNEAFPPEKYDTKRTAEAEQMEKAAKQLLKAVIRVQTGVLLTDDEIDVRDREGTMRRVMDKLADKQENAALGGEKGSFTAENAPKERKKTAKQLAKEAREKEAEATLAQGIKKIYRVLASLVHPDKATDAGDEAYRLALMKEVNVAYEANDLLRLLELQADLLKHDESHMNNLSGEMLATYNTLLKRQIDELLNEEMHHDPSYNGHPLGQYYGGTKAAAEQRMKRAAKQLTQSSKAVENTSGLIDQHTGWKSFLKEVSALYSKKNVYW